MRIKNRLYVSWGPHTGEIDCKVRRTTPMNSLQQIGPETPCICGHRYRKHTTDFAEVPAGSMVEVSCRDRGCACRHFQFALRLGNNMVSCFKLDGHSLFQPKCSCKHDSPSHSMVPPYPCDQAGCACAAFKSTLRCDCGAIVLSFLLN